MDFDLKGFEFASSAISKRQPSGVHPPSGQLFAGFPAVSFLLRISVSAKNTNFGDFH